MRLHGIRPIWWLATAALAGLIVPLAIALVSFGPARAQPGPGAESSAVATIETQLEPGFNLVGSTDIPTAIDVVFQDFDARVTAAFKWDAAAQAFRSARRSAPAFLNDLETLFTGEGVWLLVEGDQPLSWTRQLVLEEHSQGLAPGLNLVAWLGPDGAAVRDAVASAGSLVSVSAYDAARRTFLSYGPGRLDLLNTLHTLPLGAGLWLAVSDGEQWALPSTGLDSDPPMEPDPGADQAPSPPAAPPQPSCAPRGADPLFTAPVTDIDGLAFLQPLGQPALPVAKGHTFLTPSAAARAAAGGQGVPIYAPAGAELTALAYYQEGLGQYLLFFEVNCDLVFKLDHLSAVVDKIRAVAPATPQSGSRTTEVQPRIAFAAGELIGWARGAGGTGPFDFGAYDATHRNTFANQARYEASHPQELSSVCPYALYDAETRDQFLALLASPDGVPSTTGDCGSASNDVPGSVAGSWFDPTTGEGVMAVVWTSSGQVRLVGAGWNTWVDPGAATNVGPETVTDRHCYAGGGSWSFLALQADGSLLVAHGSGGCPVALPADVRPLIR